jgi:multisubunit Na+/H+ antiporter MnhF subunit
MHSIVFHLAIVCLFFLLIVCLVLLLRTRSLLSRVLALDTFSLLLTAVLILFAHAQRSPLYLDAALLLALLSFVETLAAARYASEGRIFS